MRLGLSPAEATEMHDDESLQLTTRRRVLVTAATSGLALAAWGGAAIGGEPEKIRKKGKQGGEEVVAPAEDLMREHGVLDRVLLVYEEGMRRMGAGQDLPMDTLHSATGIIHRFIEEYHEKLEEEFVFARFQQGELGQLAKVLRQQHERGRQLTDLTMRLAVPETIKKEPDRQNLERSMRAFIRMYRPHAAREDTVLFPAFHEILGQKAYAELGEKFEEREHALFGPEGFRKFVDEVAQIEKELGIYELPQFTP